MLTRLSLCRARCGPGATNRLPRLRSLSSHPATAAAHDHKLAPGQELEGFVVQRVQEVPEFQMTATELRHTASGASYLHVYRSDSNNAFSVAFRTTPTDSTGLPHILEHTTLCGSVRYPCRDPFFKMLNRSMATFMNALTGPDYTMYPFATQNPYDYNNLMSVYLDAVFKPQLRESDFRQEGWRLEHENISDPDSPVIFKGVVFNEMKGAFSDPQSVFGQALLNSLLPSHTYGVVSGGDPKVIPNLTHTDLKAFHARFYHPSNARFYSYGNFPLIDHLTYINQNYLSSLEGTGVPAKAATGTAVPLEPRWSTPQERTISCRLDPLAPDPNKQTTVAVSALLHDIHDLDAVFDWSVLAELLVKGPNAAFYRSLVEPQLGAGFAPATGFESQTRDTFFTVGLQGVAPDDADRVVEAIDRTVDTVVDKGFEAEHVEAVLHGIELNMKHETADFGLGLFFGLMPLWNHDGDVLEALQVNKRLEQFRRRIRDNPMYLQEVVDQGLRQNKHRLLLTMSPDSEYEQRQTEAEKELLKARVSRLGVEERTQLHRQGLELAEAQAKEQDTSCLPTLRVEDLAQELEPTALLDRTVRGVPLQACLQPTNELVYFRGMFNVAHLPEEHKPLLPLLASVLAKMGTRSHSYRDLDQRIQLKTGGVGFAEHLADDPAKPGLVEEGLLMVTRALERNVPDMFSILTEILTEVTLEDEKRLATLVRMSAAQLSNNITDMGHHYAMASAASLVGGSCWRREQYSGLTHVAEMRRIAQLPDLSETLAALRQMAKAVLNKCRLRCAVNCRPQAQSDILLAVDSFLDSVPGCAEDQPFLLTPAQAPQPDSAAIHHVLPIPVNFAAKVVRTVPYQHTDYAPLRILSRLLSAKYLHTALREKGGAYGGGATVSTAGTFSFYSYRDPNSTLTLDTFDGGASWVREGRFSEQDLEEAKLGVFQAVDSPVPPGQKGALRFLHGISDALLQEHRRRLMATSREQVTAVAASYLNPAPEVESAVGRALLGPENPELQRARAGERWAVRAHE